jgi:hypothetical protein
MAEMHAVAAGSTACVKKKRLALFVSVKYFVKFTGEKASNHSRAPSGTSMG